MGMGASSVSDKDPNGWGGRAQGLAVKTLVLIGGALLLKRLTKSTTRWDHARFVSQSLTGEKVAAASVLLILYISSALFCFSVIFVVVGLALSIIEILLCLYCASSSPGSKHPEILIITSILGTLYCQISASLLLVPYCGTFNFVRCRMFLCPAAEMVDGSKVLYFEQVSTYAIRDAEEYKNFCDRPKDQRPLPEEVIGDIAEHLTTLYLNRCDRRKRCLYEGSTPPEGFPNTWNGASYCTSELAVLKNNEVHMWDRGYDDDGNQVWGVREGAYEFKPAPASSNLNGIFSSLNFPPAQSIAKKIEGSFVLED
ncbi:unnamed protein product [Linum tenue]|uniref:Uncharacterized protein n=1 Tax=Linum tenue TaxID=586396 RepID=A0AAV0ML15_9ROSI|nr:unnamed protein product [Linum tenue]